MPWYIINGTLLQSPHAPAYSIPVPIEWDSERITLPHRISGIGRMALSHLVYLREIVLPDSIEIIGKRAFWGCERLTTLHLSEGITHIGEEAFAWCSSLKRLTLPKSLVSLGCSAFKGCTSLQEICIAPDHPTLRTENGLIFSREGTLLYAPPHIKEVVLPEGITAIADSAFTGCTDLRRASLPDSLHTIGQWSFSDCTNLSELTLPRSLHSIGYRAFENCTSLTDIALPVGLTELGEMTFGGCTNLTALSLPGRFIEGLDEDLVKQLCYIRCLSDPAEVGVPLRQTLCISYAEQEERYPDEVRSAHFELIRKSAVRLRKAAFEHPRLLHLMCREGLISARQMDGFMEEAEQHGDIELTARLLDYQANVLTFEAVWKARDQRERRREREDNLVFERASARMDQQGIRGLNFAAAGKLNSFPNRAALKAFLAAHGAVLLSGASAKVDFLIVNHPDPQNSAVARALELGIELINEDELKQKAKDV